MFAIKADILRGPQEVNGTSQDGKGAPDIPGGQDLQEGESLFWGGPIPLHTHKLVGTGSD